MPSQNEKLKILQIIPAQGWKAVFVDDAGKPFMNDLVCWALVDEGGETTVYGMDGIDRAVDFVDISNFLGYHGPNGEDNWSEEASKRVQN